MDHGNRWCSYEDLHSVRGFFQIAMFDKTRGYPHCSQPWIIWIIVIQCPSIAVSLCNISYGEYTKYKDFTDVSNNVLLVKVEGPVTGILVWHLSSFPCCSKGKQTSMNQPTNGKRTSIAGNLRDMGKILKNWRLTRNFEETDFSTLKDASPKDWSQGNPVRPNELRPLIPSKNWAC